MSASLFAISSRRLIAAGTILALAACGGGGSGSSPIPGGGGGGSTPAPTAAPTATPTPGSIPAGYGKPVFHITIPRSAGSGQVKSPSFISTATQSVLIQLTADSQGIDPASIANNPAITDVSGASCSSGCTVDGPLSPIGSNTYTITTYDTAGAAGHALDTAVDQVFTIAQGVANNENATLLGIPDTIAFPDGLPPAMTAGSAWNTYLGPAGNRVIAKDAAGQVITGTYSSPIIINDPDTNGDGSFVSMNPCPSVPPTANPTIAASSAELDHSYDNVFFCYGGIDEDPVTIEFDAGSASNSAAFTPVLNAPVYVSGSGTPQSSVVESGSPDLHLYALTGLGSTVSATATEMGWTDSPYNQTLTAFTSGCNAGGPINTYATFGTVYDPSGTILTLTVIGSPAAGACPVYVHDGTSTNTSQEFFNSYTSTGFTINSTRKSR